MLFRSTAVENLSFISYFDLLGNDELANVLERLPVQDRMQAELINKRWFNVARGKSWVNFNFLMAKDFEWVRKMLHNTDWTWIDATSFYQFKNMALMEIDNSQLKYIKINLKPATFTAGFNYLLRWLPQNLRGLSIGLAQVANAPVGYLPQNVFTVQMLESLCNNRRRFSKLEHLELCNLSLGTLDNEQDMDTLCRCLAHLRSISLRFEDPAIYSHVMDRICLCIASNPDLECLMVTTKLFAFSIESLLRNCQKLRYLSWHSTDPVDYDELHLLMDAVREGQPTPTRREVEKLLHVSVVGCFSENVGDMPSHPWIKYHESDFGDSPIANDIKFANVEKKLPFKSRVF